MESVARSIDAENAFALWARLRADLRTAHDETPWRELSATRARARNRIFILELVAKKECLGGTRSDTPRTIAADPGPSYLPAAQLAEWARERWGDDAEGASESTFWRAIRDLVRGGWVKVTAGGQYQPWKGKRAPLALRAGPTLLAVLGRARGTLLRAGKTVTELVHDGLRLAAALARKGVIFHPRSTQFSSQGVRTTKEDENSPWSEAVRFGERVRKIFSSRTDPPNSSK